MRDVRDERAYREDAMRERLEDAADWLCDATLALDDWPLGLAGACVVAWVRHTLTSSRALLAILGGLAVILGVGTAIFAAVGRDGGAVAVGVLLVIAVVGGAEMRGEGANQRIAALPEFRALLVLLLLVTTAFACGGVVVQLLTGTLRPFDVTLYLGQLVFLVVVYLARVPPLDPPVRRDRRVPAGA